MASVVSSDHCMNIIEQGLPHHNLMFTAYTLPAALLYLNICTATIKCTAQHVNLLLDALEQLVCLHFS